MTEPNIRLPKNKKQLILNKDTLTFFHFGCWNRQACVSEKKEKTYLSLVVDDLINNSNLYDFGIINGDNVYPNKEKNALGEKVKTFPPSRLKDGFDCISKINKPLFVNLGNHDIDECKILDQYRTSLGDNISVHDSGSLIVKTNTSLNVFLFINTNFMDIKEKEFDGEINRKKSCYHERIQSKAEFLEHRNQVIESLKKNLISLKECEFNKMKVNIFIVGHNPLLAVKEKHNEIDVKYNDDMKEITNAIFSVNLPEVYYLAADVHNYQNISIIHKINNSKIHMIASGTGGAEPDIIKKKEDVIKGFENFSSNEFSVNFNDFANSYGYSRIEIGDTVNISYKSVYDISPTNDSNVSPPISRTPEEKLTALGGGYYHKYMKYKSKYIELKKKL
jgi:hypothetical protein